MTLDDYVESVLSYLRTQQFHTVCPVFWSMSGIPGRMIVKRAAQEMPGVVRQAVFWNVFIPLAGRSDSEEMNAFALGISEQFATVAAHCGNCLSINPTTLRHMLAPDLPQPAAMETADTLDPDIAALLQMTVPTPYNALSAPVKAEQFYTLMANQKAHAAHDGLPAGASSIALIVLLW